MSSRLSSVVQDMEAQRPLDETVGKSVKNATIAARKGFVRKVYGILSAQLLLTVAIAAWIWKGGEDREWLRSHEWLLWVSVVMTFATMCCMVCCQALCRTFPANYIFLFSFTLFEGIMIGFVSAMFTWESLLLAASVTVLIFFCFTIYAFNTENDFTGFMPYLFGMLLVLGLFGLTLAILPVFNVYVSWATALYDILGVLVFTLYIVFDTQLILGEWGGHRFGFSIDDYVFAALNLYMDIINLFLHVLSLMGQRR
eukprot:CAMPEP_0179208900 /NCGR_PEP_ID=MMETSP0796-20121207/104182_1 /TAXON_ID=73915 /ORGANISM="Pyrodinium bahamense, Strain pbaha01" /LENGTH=254 /DNA_ID=CAMNT_0020913853 /DNA_START=93 /DNA_END=854 /DNA_ORIENTATION=-